MCVTRKGANVCIYMTHIYIAKGHDAKVATPLIQQSKGPYVTLRASNTYTYMYIYVCIAKQKLQR